jgi:hypothetical protein
LVITIVVVADAAAVVLLFVCTAGYLTITHRIPMMLATNLHIASIADSAGIGPAPPCLTRSCIASILQNGPNSMAIATPASTAIGAFVAALCIALLVW